MNAPIAPAHPPQLDRGSAIKNHPSENSAMRYVLVRDDDTNALTPIDYLERLYRPFLDRGLPVNLAVIPNVRTHVTYGDGILEGFLVARGAETRPTVPMQANPELVRYLQTNSGFHVVQHGYNHEFIERCCEFDHNNRADIARRLDEGTRLLTEAGFPRPETFVAPYDRLTRTSWREVAQRFRVVSTGWFELGRLPFAWWPQYVWKKLRRARHWQIGRTLLLSHPGCHLSHHRAYDTILDRIKESIAAGRVTVLVTHWWEFFREQRPDDRFIEVLHQTADFLASRNDIRVIRFSEAGQALGQSRTVR